MHIVFQGTFIFYKSEIYYDLQMISVTYIHVGLSQENFREVRHQTYENKMEAWI